MILAPIRINYHNHPNASEGSCPWQRMCGHNYTDFVMPGSETETEGTRTLKSRHNRGIGEGKEIRQKKRQKVLETEG